MIVDTTMCLFANDLFSDEIKLTLVHQHQKRLITARADRSYMLYC